MILKQQIARIKGKKVSVKCQFDQKNDILECYELYFHLKYIFISTFLLLLARKTW